MLFVKKLPEKWEEQFTVKQEKLAKSSLKTFNNYCKNKAVKNAHNYCDSSLETMLRLTVTPHFTADSEIIWRGECVIETKKFFRIVLIDDVFSPDKISEIKFILEE